jgi:hypothetical protein
MKLTWRCTKVLHSLPVALSLVLVDSVNLFFAVTLIATFNEASVPRLLPKGNLEAVTNVASDDPDLAPPMPFK